MDQKYELTAETRIVRGATLYRVRRKSDGLLGGYIESEANLSHAGTCFLHDRSTAQGNARIIEDAQLYGEIFDDAILSGHARVTGSAFGRASISGNAIVNGKVYEFGVVRGDARVNGEVFGHAVVEGQARVNGRVYGTAHVSGKDVINGDFGG